MQNSAEIINIKLIVLGGTGAGKTSLINRFLGKEISKVRLPTIGYSILKKDYNLKLNNYILRINIWDSGRIFLLKSNPSFFVGADIALLVFDLSKPKELSEFKKFYLQNLEKYAIDCITILVGNKLDLISIKKDLKQIIKENLTTEDDLLVVSAKVGDKIDESFELLILNLLKKGEERFPNLNLEETAKEFAEVIGKSEDDLKRLIINLNNVDTISEEIESQIKSAKTDAFFADPGKGIINYSLLQSELKKIEAQKLKLKNDFLKELTEVEELINYVIKSNIKSVEETVNNLNDQLTVMQLDFEKSLDSLEKLENEEVSVISVINEGRSLKEEKEELKPAKKEIKQILEYEKRKTEKEKITISIPSAKTTDDIKIKSIVQKITEKEKIAESISKNSLYQLYEKENKGKKSIWRGNETKGFIAWKKKYLEIKIIKEGE